MHKTALIYFAIHTLVLVFYCVCLWAWLDVKTDGPGAFPGSPDWAANYWAAHDTYSRLEGLLAGFSAGTVMVTVALRQSGTRPSTGQWWPFAILALSIVVLVGGFIAEANL